MVLVCSEKIILIERAISISKTSQLNIHNINNPFKFCVLIFFQNDYLDCFDDPKNRSIGIDIKEAKVSWLAVNAYKQCNSKQKDVFRQHYGNKSSDSVSAIINLYKELDMPKKYEEAEHQLHSQILKEINEIPNHIIPHELLIRLLDNLRQGLCYV